MHMYFVYAIHSIHSKIKNYTYIWITDNLERRINQHNKWYNKTTKPYKPFFLFYSKRFETRILARKEEKRLKSWYGREFLKKELQEHINRVGLSTDR